MSRKKRRLKKSVRLTFALMSALIILVSTIWVMDIGEAKSNEGQESLEKIMAKETGEQQPAEKQTDEVENKASEESGELPDQEGQEEEPVDYEPVQQEESTVDQPGVEESSEDKQEQEEQAVQQSVYLTFDDGPNENTEGILNVLERYDAKATFFMLEPNMKRFKDSVEDMAAEGHAVGMHGVTHDAAAFYQSSQSVVGEMKKGQETLESITGIHSNLIRVPYGSVPNMTPAYREAVDRAGFHMWDWNIDSEDWRLLSEEYVPNVMEQINDFPYKESPKIILLHEKDVTLEYLEELLVDLTEKGYSMKALTEQMDTVTF
ncbi:polysaccharide deacetylase family protein [Rossellomorea vietnamensis]|uniref:polysaccharide deacetylase family protein n=1 Tax=Rossellomorea vietnamensis TaxID=218284 RepID=UPI001E5F100D|nr:polysaccharide deacetylase family protein [Rossellomorea vietnamensis]MCC5800792.1 polysaccharide deacetylase family protein [Rossellomorea vietnamensis]